MVLISRFLRRRGSVYFISQSNQKSYIILLSHVLHLNFSSFCRGTRRLHPGKVQPVSQEPLRERRHLLAAAQQGLLLPLHPRVLRQEVRVHHRRLLRQSLLQRRILHCHRGGQVQVSCYRLQSASWCLSYLQSTKKYVDLNYYHNL